MVRQVLASSFLSGERKGNDALRTASVMDTPHPMSTPTPLLAGMPPAAPPMPSSASSLPSSPPSASSQIQLHASVSAPPSVPAPPRRTPQKLIKPARAPFSATPYVPPSIAAPMMPASTSDPSLRNNASTKRTESSESIRGHADIIMQLIDEQRQLAAHSAAIEAESLRVHLGHLTRELEGTRAELVGTKEELNATRDELEITKQELEGTRKELKDAQEDLAKKSAEATNAWQNARDTRTILETKGKAFLENLRVEALRELERLKRENEELKGKIIGGPVKNEGAHSDTATDRKGEENTEKDALHKRYEEMEREIERLRKSEANLLQRIEIFESMNASANSALQSMENLPDLSGALDMLREHLSNDSTSGASVSGQMDTHGKKRKLEATNVN